VSELSLLSNFQQWADLNALMFSSVSTARNIIEAVKKLIIVFTDHLVTSFIACQIKLINSFTDKLNLHLICVSQYLSQFKLNIQYKLNKTHIVLNALSWLAQIT